MKVYAYIGTYNRGIAEIICSRYTKLVITGIDADGRAEIGIDAATPEKLIAIFQRKAATNTL